MHSAFCYSLFLSSQASSESKTEPGVFSSQTLTKPKVCMISIINTTESCISTSWRGCRLPRAQEFSMGRECLESVQGRRGPYQTLQSPHHISALQNVQLTHHSSFVHIFWHSKTNFFGSQFQESHCKPILMDWPNLMGWLQWKNAASFG